MKAEHVIGVRYCGGCNPRFDRVVFVKRLETLLPDIRFETARAGTDYAAALVVCGCRTKCANVGDLPVPPSRMVYVGGFDEILPTRDRLKALTAAADAQELGKEQVLSLLPHRPPMLFIDGVTRLIPGQEALAVFFADPALDIFAGHFPEKPVFPGVLVIEAMAQAADIMLLSLEKYQGKTPFLLGLGKADFRRPVLPGSVLEIHASLLADKPEMGAAVCRGQVYSENHLMASAEIILAMR